MIGRDRTATLGPGLKPPEGVSPKRLLLAILVQRVGQAIGPNSSPKEAAAGIISETIYHPLAAWLSHLLLG